MPYKDFKNNKEYLKEYCKEWWIRKKELKKKRYLNCKLCGKKITNSGFYCRDCFIKTGRNHKLWNKGKKYPEIGIMRTGKKNPNWKGGATSESKKLQNSQKWKDWRKLVFERDNYTSRDCNRKGRKLHPHHIFERSRYPNFVFEIWNGRTLCEKCHKKTYYKEEKYREDLFAKQANSVKLPMSEKIMDNAELNRLTSVNV